MKYKDYYQVLGVDRDASSPDIKRAYRRLAKRFHPDVSDDPSAEERFKEVNEAYEVLKDDGRRRAYNELGTGRYSGDDFRPPPNWSAQHQNIDREFSQAEVNSFSDFFNSFFTRATTTQQGPGHEESSEHFRMRGSDQHGTVIVSLEESYFGRERTVDFTPEGAPAPRRLKVKIPCGIIAGQRIRLHGQGMAGYGGEANGDLYLTVEFERHQWFEVKARDVFLDVPIAPWEAALGAKIEVPTLGGLVSLSIPEGARTDQRLRLAGRGLPGRKRGNKAGDQFVDLKIVSPRADTAEKTALYKQMQAEMHFNARSTWAQQD